jgi:hypothetical protein
LGRKALSRLIALSPAIGFQAGSSTGVTVQVAEVRTLVVTNESVEKTVLMPGQSLSYYATIFDNTGAPIPSAFQARLMLDTTLLVAFSFAPDVYNPTTGRLALAFTVPSVAPGTYTIRLEWDAQAFA